MFLPYFEPRLITLLAAGFAAKSLLLILMTSSSVATGSAHSKLIIWTDQMLTRRAMFRLINIYPIFVYYMRWFVASDQFRQLSLLWRRYKFKDHSRFIDEAQNKAEARIYI